MKESIINQLEAALDETMQLLSSFSKEDANTAPFRGSWTAAQVAQHLYLSERGMDELLLTQTEALDRQPDENAEELKKLLLNLDIKMDSPEFIVPEEKNYDKEELIQLLQDVKDTLLKAIQDANLTQEAPLPPGHPLAGNTKLEIVYFIAYHTMRHNQQIRNIKESLLSKIS